jgi:hypothetical protein
MLLHWRIGRRIHVEILSGERAPYVEVILATLSRQWVAESGRSSSARNPAWMVPFAHVLERLSLGWRAV